MHAAQVEGAEIAGGIAAIKENAADEKPGENEKEVHATPTGGESGEKAMRPESKRPAGGAAYLVAEEDEEDGEAAQTVKLRDALTRSGTGLLHVAVSLKAWSALVRGYAISRLLGVPVSRLPAASAWANIPGITRRSYLSSKCVLAPRLLDLCAGHQLLKAKNDEMITS
jgi:hypothetical protein